MPPARYDFVVPKLSSAALPALISFLLATLVFGICLRNDFVYDDVLLILMDSRAHEVGQWGRYWIESYNDGVDNLYRPLVSMSYAVQWKLHGAIAWPYFAFNIVLHAACAAAVAEWVRRLILCSKPIEVARTPDNTAVLAGLAAGAIFAVHPAHCEAVASVVGRCETMCALPALIALILLLGRVTMSGAVLIWFASIISLLSKEHALLLPLLMLIQAALFGFNGGRRERFTLMLLMLWSWAGYIVLRENILKFWWDRSALDWTAQPMILSSGADRIFWPIALLGRYAALLVWPARLSIDHGLAVTSPAIARDDIYIHLGAAAALAWIICLLLALRARHRAGILLLLSLALMYSVIANALTLIGTIFGERLIYFPSVFLIALAGLTVARWKRASIAIVLIAVILGSWRTFAYIRTFDDRLSFYEQSVGAQPKSIKLRILLASEFTSRRRLEEAAAVAAAARAIAPDAPEPWYQSGYIESQRGNYDEARRFLTESIRLSRNPTKPAAMLQNMDATMATTRAAATTQPSGR
jgi:tetratricopeptide (TPR) repeat protein